jgi:hypothetical protein
VIPVELESEACVAAKVLTHFFNMESELTVWSLEDLDLRAFHLA